MYWRSIISRDAVVGFNISYRPINVHHSLRKLMDNELLNFTLVSGKFDRNENNLVGLTHNGGGYGKLAFALFGIIIYMDLMLLN